MQLLHQDCLLTETVGASMAKCTGVKKLQLPYIPPQIACCSHLGRCWSIQGRAVVPVGPHKAVQWLLLVYTRPYGG